MNEDLRNSGIYERPDIMKRATDLLLKVRDKYDSGDFSGAYSLIDDADELLDKKE